MRRVASWIDIRSVPSMATMVCAVVGGGYWFLWMMLAHDWQSYSDLSNSAGLALAIGHGHFGAVYAPGSQLDSPPGLEFLLAPVMVVAHALGFGLVPSAGDHMKSTIIFVAAVATALGCVVLFALDAVARQWGFSEPRRLALCAVAGLGVVSAASFWGHPEDAIALAFVLWAALAVERGGSGGLRRAAWLLGLAVACQPLAVLAVAPIVARAKWADWFAVAWRLVLPSALVLLPEILAAPARAIHAVVDQPFFPAAESSTPFSHFARALGHGMYSGGTLRLPVTLTVVLLGFLACRRRHDLPFVLFVVALAFTLRVIFESELLGFYFYPVVALCLLLSLRRGWARFDVAAVLSVVVLVLGNRREHEIVLWWPAMMAATLAMLVVAYSSLPAGEAGGAELRRLARKEAPGSSWVTISHVRLLDAADQRRLVPT